MTLKLVLEPGELPCTWLVPDIDEKKIVELSGVLEVQPNVPPSGGAWGKVPTKFTSNESGSVSAGFPQSRALAVVEGHLVSGISITLLDAVLDVWAPDRLHLSAAAAVIGARPPIAWPSLRAKESATASSLPTFSSIQLQVEGLDEIAGIAAEIVHVSPERIERYVVDRGPT